MTANRGPGVRQIGAVGTTPKEHRLAIAGQYAETSPGVPRSGLLLPSAVDVVTPTGDVSPMSYAVLPISAVINRTAGEGVYTPTTTGTSAVPTTAAPASGSRWDLIWIKQNDQEKGDADNNAVLGVTQGVAAGSPTRPTSSVPAGALVVGEGRVFAGTTSTTQSPNTVSPAYQVTAARGAPVPVLTVADRNTLTKRPGLQVMRLDRGGHVQMWTGTSWRWVSPPERYQISAATFNNTSSVGSKLIASLTGVPEYAYAVKCKVGTRMTVSSGAISTASMTISVCVSVGQSDVALAQAKASLTFANPGNYKETRDAETDWIAMAGPGAPTLIRCWTEQLSGTVANRADNIANSGSLWAEILPVDD